MTELSLAGGRPAIAPDPTRSRRRRTSAGVLDVFRNRPFLLLWLSQAFTQIGGNMVIYGLTVIILEATRSNTAVSLLILTFLVPAVLFSAVAGVYVDRLDKRARPDRHQRPAVARVRRCCTSSGANLGLILLLNVARSRRSRCSSRPPRRR